MGFNSAFKGLKLISMKYNERADWIDVCWDREK
jgi:hypothetical protein